MIRIITDSVTSLTREAAEKLGVTLVSMFINHHGEETADLDMDLDGFYGDIYDMIDDLPTSSQPSQHTLETLFEEAALAGDEVLGIFISQDLSGTFEGAIRAARVVGSHHLDFRCVLLDSASCCFDEAFPVIEAVEARDRGLSLEECAATVQATVGKSRILFVPESLTFLQKGGRIGGAAALLGNMLNMAPIITVEDGTPQPVAKVRTRKKALARMLEIFKRDIEECGLKRVVVQYIGEKKHAIEWAKDVVEPLVGRVVEVFPVSPVIGLHVGPAVGIAYECLQSLKGKFSGSFQERLFVS